LINQRNIGVVIEALPLNNNNLSIGDRYEVSDPEDIKVIKNINLCIVHTNIVEDLWQNYMNNWLSNKILLHHIPYAGNILRSLPDNFDINNDICYIGNLFHKMERIYEFIVPLFNRISFLGLSSSIYGDDLWNNISVSNNGTIYDLDVFKNIYSKSLISLNIHSKNQVDFQACLNERSFSIQLCGGLQITDMTLANRYFDNNVLIGNTLTSFIHLMEKLINNRQCRFDFLMKSIENSSYNHTYFNRLSNIFQWLSMGEEYELCEREGFKLANLHMWNMEIKLKCFKKGRRYESHISRLV
jgi:hypothetical protein